MLVHRPTVVSLPAMSESHSAGVGTRTRRDAPPTKKSDVQQCPRCGVRPVDGFDADRGEPTCRQCASVSGTGWFVRARELVGLNREVDDE